MLNSRKAASPVIATLLMIAVAVTMAVLAYTWTMGLTGNLMGSGGSQVREQLIMEAYSWPAGTNTFTVDFRNVGSVSVTIQSIYVGGNLASGISGAIAVGSLASGTVTVAGTYTDGVAYTLKVVTQTGGVFTFVITRGGAG